MGDGNDSALFRPPTLGGAPGIEDALNVDHVIDGGTGDDRVTIASAAPIVSSPTVGGGPGDDVLRGGGYLDGGGGRDELYGFPGSVLTDGDTEGSVDADMLHAGGGGQVDYGSRTRPLHIDLHETTASQGERGEGDRITGATNVRAGHANDFLGGTAADNSLSGGPGNDQIDGRGGDDSIGVNGRDRAFGGAGNDEFEWEGGPGSFQSTIVCGRGNTDSSLGATGGPGPWLSRTCEFVVDNLFEDVVLAPPAQPLGASRRGRLVFRLSRFCLTGRYRLTLTSVRAPLRRLATRRIETKAGHCAALHWVAVKLPLRLARRAHRRPVRLRERIDFHGIDGRRSLVWRFDLRLPGR